MENTKDVFSGPHLWGNGSLFFNNTAANSSSLGSLVSSEMDKAINIIMIVVLFITMVSMGCTMEVSKIKAHLVKPKGVAIALVAQYGVMPLTAFCLAKAFQLGRMEAVSVLLCGCCPGGSLSNLLALGLQGDMNLSIVMTTCSTVLALGMMPLLLYLYCQGFSNLQDAVPYIDIILALVMILIPCGVGILINYYRPQYAKYITKVGLTILMVAVVAVGVMYHVGMGHSVLAILSPTLMTIAFLMPLIGYIFGYVVSWVFPPLLLREQRTVAMETGCQNIQLCTTILKVAFPPEIIGPLFLFPLVYVTFQLTEAAVLILVFRCYQLLKPKKKGKQRE
uniref:Hepatic sodium/bile acid cotransporter n=1 Tax=Myripristis murdjan TaxID=586833 RepID=A0A667YNV1_9TELE